MAPPPPDKQAIQTWPARPNPFPFDKLPAELQLEIIKWAVLARWQHGLARWYDGKLAGLRRALRLRLVSRLFAKEVLVAVWNADVLPEWEHTRDRLVFRYLEVDDGFPWAPAMEGPSVVSVTKNDRRFWQPYYGRRAVATFFSREPGVPRWVRVLGWTAEQIVRRGGWAGGGSSSSVPAADTRDKGQLMVECATQLAHLSMAYQEYQCETLARAPYSWEVSRSMWETDMYDEDFDYDSDEDSDGDDDSDHEVIREAKLKRTAKLQRAARIDLLSAAAYLEKNELVAELLREGVRPWYLGDNEVDANDDKNGVDLVKFCAFPLPVSAAAFAGNEEALSMFFELDSDDNFNTSFPDPIMAWASYGGHPDIFRTGLDRYRRQCSAHAGQRFRERYLGLDWELKRSAGRTPHPACLRLCSEELIRERLDDEDDFSLPSVEDLGVVVYRHHNPFDWPTQQLSVASSEGNLELVELVLNLGADVDLPFRHSRFPWGHVPTRLREYSPLAVACYRGHFDAARLLLDRGARRGGLDVLPAAAASGVVRMVTLLLTHGTTADTSGGGGDDNPKEPSSSTPSSSSSNGSATTAGGTAARGAMRKLFQPTAVRSAVLAAVRNENPVMLRFLLANGAGEMVDAKTRVEAWRVASELGMEDMVRLLAMTLPVTLPRGAADTSGGGRSAATARGDGIWGWAIVQRLLFPFRHALGPV